MNFFHFGKPSGKPSDKPSDNGLRVTFFMTGGQNVVTTGVKEITTTKNGEGNFSSYSIEWHEGKKPAFFSLALDHIAGIVAELI